MSVEAPKKVRAIIVDDEELARQMLCELLRTHPDIEIAAECANGFEAVKAVAELKPDLVFLDVQMPKLDGFEVLELTGTDMAIIFTTAYDQYALRAFDAHAVDYLLKPFGADRLEAALARVRERFGGKVSAPVELAAAARPPEQFAERIVVKDGTRVQIIPVGKLDYAEAQDDYVALCAEGKKHLKQQPISSLEKILDPARFLRVHRSFIVNVECVARIEPYGKETHVAVLTNGAKIPVSRNGYAKLREFLK
jgi:two-component system, LytTR family, response regulator